MVHPSNDPVAVPVGLEMPLADWQQTPPRVQTLVVALLRRLEALAARLQQDSTTSQRPPSADAPSKKARQSSRTSAPRKAGGHPGHPGHRQRLVPPTAMGVLTPPQCACGHTALVGSKPSQTPQVIAVPPLQMEVTHVVLPHAWCPFCAQWTKAQLPPAHTAGYGPRWTALSGERAGTHGTGRRTLQPFCASVLQMPLRLGAIQKRLDRVSQASAPHSKAMACHARQAPVHDSDATPWYLATTLQGLWVMAHETVACSMMHPPRSQEALPALVEEWAGLLVSDGDGVYHTWVTHRHTCVAHRIRTARGFAARAAPDLAACGTWALAELQRRCPMATAPPTGGEGRAWSARLCHCIDQYHTRPDDAGRLARHLLREMASRWVFLAQHGVEPTNNRAERALRCGVLWRKRSHGTARDKGNRWGERSLSLKETCRLQARAT